MKVQIDEKAKEWLDKKITTVTLTKVPIMNCCVPIEEVSIQYRKPENPQLFHQVQLDWLTVFIDKNIQLKDGSLKLSLTGFGPFKTLQVDGLARL